MADRRAVRELVRLLRSRALYERPCYVKRTPHWAALIVPHLRNGTDGPYSYLRTFRRSTLDTAVAEGLVVLGDSRVEVPPIGGKHWSAQREMRGRTIALTDPPEQDGDSRD